MSIDTEMRREKKGAKEDKIAYQKPKMSKK